MELENEQGNIEKEPQSLQNEKRKQHDVIVNARCVIGRLRLLTKTIHFGSSLMITPEAIVARAQWSYKKLPQQVVVNNWYV